MTREQRVKATARKAAVLLRSIYEVGPEWSTTTLRDVMLELERALRCPDESHEWLGGRCRRCTVWKTERVADTDKNVESLGF